MVEDMSKQQNLIADEELAIMKLDGATIYLAPLREEIEELKERLKRISNLYQNIESRVQDAFQLLYPYLGEEMDVIFKEKAKQFRAKLILKEQEEYWFRDFAFFIRSIAIKKARNYSEEKLLIVLDAYFPTFSKERQKELLEVVNKLIDKELVQKVRQQEALFRQVGRRIGKYKEV